MKKLFALFLFNLGVENRMAQNKRMVTPCRDMNLDAIYASFGDIDPARIIFSYELGLADAPDVQVRRAGFQMMTGAMTLEEAIAAFGTLE